MDQIIPEIDVEDEDDDHDHDHVIPPRATPKLFNMGYRQKLSNMGYRQKLSNMGYRQKLSNMGYRRKQRRKNIVHRLFDQQYQFKPNVHPSVSNHKLYQWLVPNFSVENVERPSCYFRKFTNDGRYLMAFCSDWNSILLYQYQGPMAAAKLLEKIPSNPDHLNGRGGIYSEVRRDIFNCFFTLHRVIRVCYGGEQLNRDCSLFTEDNRFIIVASLMTTNEAITSFFHRNQNNESIPLNSRLSFEDSQFHLIDIEAAKVTDRIEFKCDKINLFFNHGLYLYKNLLSILSVQHQTIYLYYIQDNGKFIPVRKIGRFCHEDDLLLYESTFINNPTNKMSKRPVPAFREAPYNSLKHRLLTFMYRKFSDESRQQKSFRPVQNFYKDFNLFLNLRMWKIQLLDEDHMLIKYEQESTVIKAESTSFVKNSNLFVVYNWKTTEIIEVFPQHSTKLLKAYEMFSDYFRHPPGPMPCSISNNYYARKTFMDYKRSLIEKANGNEREAIRSILAVLPQNVQSITFSPYLDLSLFSYDDKAICCNEKPRYTSEFPIRFHERDTGLFSFRLHTGQMYLPPHAQTSAQRFLQPNSLVPYRRLIAFIFHPFDPFIISIQPFNSTYLQHFHIRHFNPTV